MSLQKQWVAWLRRTMRGWRQAVRMTAAALLAYGATQLLHLHEGQWAIITCLVVVQGSFASTLDASLSRIYGTCAGALAGGLGALAVRQTGLPEMLILGLAVAPTAALSVTDPRFRLAPVTAGLVMLAVSAGDAGLRLAVDRVSEILVGVVIGVACTALILPERADDKLKRHVANALEALGEVARAHLGRDDAGPSLVRMDSAFAMAQTTAAEVAREQQVRFLKGPPPQPLMIALRRLRTNVGLIDRAMQAENARADNAHADNAHADRAFEADAAVDWFAVAATALRTDFLPTPPPQSDAGETESFTAFHFALAALQREQSNFQACMAGWVKTNPH